MYTYIYKAIYGQNARDDLNDSDMLRAILRYCLQDTWQDYFSAEQLEQIERIKRNRKKSRL